MPDGVRLSAHIGLPDGNGPFPAVIEGTPYRKGLASTSLESLRYQSLLRRGYALVVYDVRGTGDSYGATSDPWSDEETCDGCQVVNWVADQPWCNGNVGMWGLSYTAMLALHVAARNPAPLKALIVVGGPDDCHSGLIAPCGALRAYQYEQYAPLMAAYNFGPPFAEVSGDRWEQMWQERIDQSQPWSLNVLSHQLDGPYWRSRSLPPDYERIRCPIYLVTGWADWYPSTYLRAFGQLQVPKRILVGPWEHRWPNVGRPGPRIDGYHDFGRWFDRWLNRFENGIDREPPVIVFVQSHKRPDRFCTQAAGDWRSETEWPLRRVVSTRMYLRRDAKLNIEPENSAEDQYVEFTYDPTVGTAAGRYVAGMMHDWGQPEDQRLDEPFSLVYSTDPLPEDLELVGDPLAELHISSTATIAAFYVKICDVAPDGTSLLVSKGGLNATQRDSSVEPNEIEPGKVYRLRFPLTSLAHRFRVGHQLRVMIAGADFPNDWPTPAPGVHRVHVSHVHTSHIVLPVAPNQTTESPRPNVQPCHDPLPEANPIEYEIQRDVIDRTTEVSYTIPAGVGINSAKFRVDVDNPAHAVVESSFRFHQDVPSGVVEMISTAVTRSDAEFFHHVIDVKATNAGKTFFSKSWSKSVPRALL